MPFQPVGNGAEVVIHGLADGQVCMTTLGFLGSVGFVVQDIADLVSNIQISWSTYMLPLLPASYKAVQVVGRGLRTEVDVENTLPFPAPSSGTKVGNALPNNVSLAVSFRTGLTGRNNRGRNFVPMMVEDDVSGNAVSASLIAQWIAAYVSLRVAVENDEVFLLGVISRYTANTLRASGVVQPVLTFSVSNNIVDSMRRRLPGRGA